MIGTKSKALLAASAAALVLVWLLWAVVTHRRAPASATPPAGASTSPLPAPIPPVDSSGTTVWAHNVRLHQGPIFRVYINWIRGQMLPTDPNVLPSLDSPDSFAFQIEKGVIHANLNDFAHYLQADAPPGFSLQNIHIAGRNGQLRITGTLHKLLLPLPVELLCTVSPRPNNQVLFHVDRISVLKLPMKSLLGGFHVGLDDILGKTPMHGLRVAENDLLFDPSSLFPAPHIRGQPTSITVASSEVLIIYGDARNDPSRLAEWHNFLRLTGGSVSFGHLTMRPADLTLIDASREAWFDLDLVHYQTQLTAGFSRITSERSLEIFMPNAGEHTGSTVGQAVPLDWLHDRKRSLPIEIPTEVSSEGASQTRPHTSPGPAFKHP